MKLKSLPLLSALAAFSFNMLSASAAQAATVVTGEPLVDGVVLTVLYSVVGIIMTFVAYKVVDLITPGDLSADIGKGNVALAILTGCFVLGISIIIAAAIVG